MVSMPLAVPFGAGPKHTHTTKQPQKGTPQGGVLSANIYIITVQALLNKFSTGPVKAIGFADNTLLITTGIDLHTLRRHMQKALADTLLWGQHEQLVFNPTKTVAMVFHTKNKPHLIEPLTMQNQTIAFTDSTRYLGIIIDNRLSWRKHVQNQANKCKKIVMMTRAAVGRTWGWTDLWTGCLVGLVASSSAPAPFGEFPAS